MEALFNKWLAKGIMANLSLHRIAIRVNKMKAEWNGKVIAESSDTVVVEGNHYFPLESLNQEFFQPSQSTTVCGWKGTAEYYNIVVDGKENPDAAWFYAEPKEKAAQIKGYVAFWKGVGVSNS